MVSRAFTERLYWRHRHWLVSTCMRDIGAHETCSLRSTSQCSSIGRRTNVSRLLFASCARAFTVSTQSYLIWHSFSVRFRQLVRLILKEEDGLHRIAFQEDFFHLDVSLLIWDVSQCWCVYKGPRGASLPACRSHCSVDPTHFWHGFQYLRESVSSPGILASPHNRPCRGKKRQEEL